MKEKRKNLTWEEIQENIRTDIAEQKEQELEHCSKYVDKVYDKLQKGHYRVDGNYIRVHVFAPELIEQDEENLKLVFSKRGIRLSKILTGILWTDFLIDIYDWSAR